MFFIFLFWIKTIHKYNDVTLVNVHLYFFVVVVLLQVLVCGNCAEAKQTVVAVATKLGFAVLDNGSLSAARELEEFPLRLFPEWRLPLRLAVGLTATFFFYLVIRDVVYSYVEDGKDISFRIMVSLANKVFIFIFFY